MSRAICREFNVSEEWLKTGDGEMYQQLSEDEEIAGIVSDLLEEGKTTLFYIVILEIVKTYSELSPASQKYSRKQPRSWLTIWQKEKGLTSLPSVKVLLDDYVNLFQKVSSEAFNLLISFIISFL